MKVYISGPISNDPEYEKKFNAAEKQLKGMGYVVSNPVRIGKYLAQELKREPTYEEYLERDIKRMKECDAIAMLPGWEKSNGARLERDIAMNMGKKMITLVNVA